MSRKPPVHTVPNGPGKWINKQGNEVISNHNLKRTAVEQGRKEAMKDQTEHVIHNTDGTIAQANSYGGDPCPPKDKK